MKAKSSHIPGPWRVVGGAVLRDVGVNATESPSLQRVAHALNCHEDLLAALQFAEAYLRSHYDQRQANLLSRVQGAIAQART